VTEIGAEKGGASVSWPGRSGVSKLLTEYTLSEVILKERVVVGFASVPEIAERHS